MRVASLLVFAVLVVATRAQFGPATRQLFMMNANYTNFNHGSYGTVPRVVHEAQNAYSLQCEQNPDAWFRFPDTGLKPILNQARKHMGTYLGITQQSDLNGLVFVDNASGAVNAVLRSLLIGATEQDVVIYFHTVYGMVRSVMQYLNTMTGVTVVQANVTLPATSPDAYTSALNSALETYGARVKMVIFSHISSVPALIEPIETLAMLTKRVAPNAAVLVDGAHALGHINVNIPNLAAAGVDFWLGNGHKWLYSPKGSCVLWVSDTFRDWTSGHGVIPNIISGLGEFTSEFAETGTKDYTAYLSMRDALDFRVSIGGDAAIMSYIRQLAWDGGQVLSRAFGNTPTMAPKEMTSALVDVQLPSWADPVKLINLTQTLYARHNTFVVIYGPYILPDGTNLGYWTRVSAQIYLDLSSFETLAQWILEALQ